MLGTVIYNFAPIGAGFSLAMSPACCVPWNFMLALISMGKSLSDPLGRAPLFLRSRPLEFSRPNCPCGIVG